MFSSVSPCHLDSDPSNISSRSSETVETWLESAVLGRAAESEVVGFIEPKRDDELDCQLQ